MANPTTNRPARPVFDATLGFGPTCKSFVACGATAGLPIELVSKTVGRVWEGNAGMGVGYAPRNKATGFTLTPDGGSPSLKFGYGSPGVVFPGRGFVTGDPVTRTMACVMRCDYTLPGVVSTAYLMNLVNVFTLLTSGQSHIGGLYIHTTLSGPTFRANTNFGSALAMGGVTFTPGHWYAVALGTDQTASPFSYRLQVYDFNTQTLATAQTLTSTQAMNLQAGAHLQIGGCDAGNAGTTTPLRGQIACVILDKQYWGATEFDNFKTDPWATVRGTQSLAGGLTAPASGQFTHGEGGCKLTFACATGTGTAGTGSPTYHLQRYTDPTTAPSSGARVVSSITTDEGGACVNVLDSTSVVGTTYWYRLECIDGSDTVYFPASGTLPLVARRRASATPLFLILAGDSRTEGNTGPVPGLLARKLDRPICHTNWGKSGSFSYQWTNGVNSRMTVSVTGGTPTSGTFILTIALAAASGINFRNVPYNCTAALLKTILEDDTGTYTNGVAGGSTSASIGGAGNVTTSGGPLPGTPIVVDFTGATAQKKDFSGTPSVGTSTLNAGSPALAINYHGKPADPTYFLPLITEIAASLAEDPDLVPWVHTAVGMNDSYAAAAPTAAVDYGRYLASGAAALVANGIKAVYSAPPLPRSQQAGNGANPTFLVVDQTYPAQLAAMADGANVFYGGDRAIMISTLENLGSVDGIHGYSGGNEPAEERWAWADAIYAAVNPPASGGGGNLSMKL